MIYITGDTHGLRDVRKFNSKKFLEEINKPENIVIVTGDFGITWSNRALYQSIEFYSQFKCKFLFVDGNNENFDILNTFKVSEEYGGKVQKISGNISHLLRGEIYEIEGKTFLAFGGATSYDSPERTSHTTRVEHESWWKEETPTQDEFQHALENLKKHGNKVDVILTHETTSTNIQRYFSWSIISPTTQMLDEIDKQTEYKMWYFGHHHFDVQVSPHERCIFEDFEDLSNLDNIPYTTTDEPTNN